MTSMGALLDLVDWMMLSLVLKERCQVYLNVVMRNRRRRVYLLIYLGSCAIALSSSNTSATPSSSISVSSSHVFSVRALHFKYHTAFFISKLILLSSLNKGIT